MNVTIKDIEDLTGHIERAITDNFQRQMEPLIAQVKTVENRVGGLEAVKATLITDITRLKSNQAKALVGWTVLVTGVTLLFNHAKIWVMGHLHL